MSDQVGVSNQSDNSLYDHEVHPHTPTNVNDVHAQERQGVNDQIAVFLTRTVGSMPMAYAFTVLAFIGLCGILGVLQPVVAVLVAWLSQTLIQLTLLPIIMVGNSVLSRHAELQAEEQFQTTQKTYHDIEQIMLHLSAQDGEILTHTQLLEAQGAELLKQTTILVKLLEAQGNTFAQGGQ